MAHGEHVRTLPGRGGGGDFNAPPGALGSPGGIGCRGPSTRLQTTGAALNGRFGGGWRAPFGCCGKRCAGGGSLCLGPSGSREHGASRPGGCFGPAALSPVRSCALSASGGGSGALSGSRAGAGSGSVAGGALSGGGGISWTGGGASRACRTGACHSFHWPPSRFPGSAACST